MVSLRIGCGFDVHAFEQEKELSKIDYADDSQQKFVKADSIHQEASHQIILGGIKLQSPWQIKAHSDGDVLLHAVVDALLGAMGAGDIGEHFPPDDDKWKNANSAVFIDKANGMLYRNHGKIVNLDVTIICQTPKISPYKNDIRNNIANMLEIETSQINVKATTTENLGFLGRGEGIAVQAVVLVDFSV